jgi:TRAP-type C4-dicarboxylate transport system substrate-binding protein
MKAASDAEARGWAESRKVNDTTLATLKANGMTVTAPTAQLKADMKKVGDTMLKEWMEKAGAEGKALIDAYSK